MPSRSSARKTPPQPNSLNCGFSSACPTSRPPNAGGMLRADSPSYVERQADKDLYDGLLKGEFCYVLTSRQMGNSSLMVRTAQKLRAQGTTVVALDLTAIVTPRG